jgi:SAM-dependent methyltransferase
MKSQSKKWANQYTKNNKNPIYPTEWVIRTISGANYPNFKYDKKLYEGKKILDISCGDGRNLQLLINLGFEVYATETDEETVKVLSKRFPSVKFSIGFNHKHEFSNDFFDFALSCGSFYYVEPKTNFKTNLRELNRILKHNAIFFANMSTKDTYVLDGAKKMKNNLYEIKNDPHGYRNGYYWQVANSKKDLDSLFNEFFKIIACSKIDDDYFGYRIANNILVAKNISQ